LPPSQSITSLTHKDKIMTANKTGRFAGEVAFVTGATSGIGRTTAIAFAQEGANVVVADVVKEGVQQTARLIERSEALPLPLLAM
jgi:NAD(P)-dependent dehydrogenase (short-subunit alcohol dehydrogenase family)